MSEFSFVVGTLFLYVFLNLCHLPWHKLQGTPVIFERSFFERCFVKREKLFAIYYICCSLHTLRGQ